MVCRQGAALNLAGTTGAAAIAFAKARQDEGPSALLQQIQKEDSSGTILNVYERVKVQSAVVVPCISGLTSASCRALLIFRCLQQARSDTGAARASTLMGRVASPGEYVDPLQGVIDSGSLVQQASVITVLRIVPFAPFRCCSACRGSLHHAAPQSVPSTLRCPAMQMNYFACCNLCHRPAQRSCPAAYGTIMMSAVALAFYDIPGHLFSQCVICGRRAVSYYLGLTPIRFSAYMAGTAAGRGFWALLYASIGAYSRTWMQRGIGLDGVLQGGRRLFW